MKKDEQFESHDDLSIYEESQDYEFFSVIGKRAATNAINENKAMDLPVTYLKDGWVVRELPGGKIEKIVEVQSKTSSLREFKKGAILHVNRRKNS